MKRVLLWVRRMGEQSSGQGWFMEIIYNGRMLILFPAVQLMGNESQLRLGADSHLAYYCTVAHPLHGSCRIFTSRALPMTFLLRLDRATLHSRLFHLFQQIQDIQCPHLLSLYGFKIERAIQCSPCADQPPPDKTVEYWEYLNYSLGQHVRDRNRRNAPFTEHEVWHVVQAVCESVKLLGEYGLVWEVNPFQLYITPEGRLKCEWSHLQINNQHLRYFRKLHHSIEKEGTEEEWGSSQTEVEWEQFTSPQEQWLVREGERSSRLNLEKSNAYKFGMLLLYVLTLETHPVPVHWQTLHKIIPQLANRYPPLIMQVLQATLIPTPSSRWNLQKVREACCEFFNPEYELLINEGRRQDLQELNIEAQFRAGSSKQTHRGLNPSQQLSVLQESGKLEESMRDRQLYEVGLRSSGGREVRNTEKMQSSVDKRTLELREYRKRLKQQQH